MGLTALRSSKGSELPPVVGGCMLVWPGQSFSYNGMVTGIFAWTPALREKTRGLHTDIDSDQQERFLTCYRCMVCVGPWVSSVLPLLCFNVEDWRVFGFQAKRPAWLHRWYVRGCDLFRMGSTKLGRMSWDTQIWCPPRPQLQNL